MAFLSAFRFASITMMRSLYIASILLTFLVATHAQNKYCGPTPHIRSQLERIRVVVTDPADFERGLGPLVALRQRYPKDLWVNERYLDVVQQYGIEGHLRKLTEEYQVLSMQHPDDLMYSYLYTRSIMGRNTASAIQQMSEMVTQHSDYAPAHGSLAEIYSSAAFHDQEREKIERDRFLALCPEPSVPEAGVQQRPAPLPEPSPLIDQAEALLKQHGAPDHIAGMAEQGVKDDEWRLQRIRPFDWYSVDYKRQAQRELQTKYWRVWAIQVRCDRAAGRTRKASELMALMEQRAASLQKQSDPVYWDALATLAILYEEANHKDLAAQKLSSMQEFLTAHSDPQRAAQLAALRKLAEQP
jgi:hypothetical protein